MGVTSVKLKPNPVPIRTKFDEAEFGWKRYAEEVRK
jgi:hypothetical protein